MNQQELKEKIFNERAVIKQEMSKTYNSKKLARAFVTILNNFDYFMFLKLTNSEQNELLDKIFGAPELVYNNIVKAKIEKAYTLATKRKKAKNEI